MEKKVSHYDLSLIKKMINDDDYFITGSARVDYTSLGFDDNDAIDIVISLTQKDLYKSMTTYQDNKIWQDVYTKIVNNISLYIKLQITQKAIIISFKERT
ncbi:MAG: type II toxin-antitoxin system MqsR family toxin [Campylobacterota bacterium]|nr:type II toxin-antitoxin system MqsR family toxin [Campylobacterota bacterium]